MILVRQWPGRRPVVEDPEQGHSPKVKIYHWIDFSPNKRYMSINRQIIVVEAALQNMSSDRFELILAVPKGSIN